MSWSNQVVEHLCDSKRSGLGFDEAWRSAIKSYPPQFRDKGLECANLFEAAQNESETIAEFTYRACSDAWHGRRPALATLRVLLEAGEVFPTAPQGRSSHRVAA